MPSKRLPLDMKQKAKPLQHSRSWQSWLPLILMPTLVLAYCLCYYGLNGEIIAVVNGFGWDGVFYGSVVGWFDKILSQPVLDPYRAQRIAPSAFLHYAMKILGSDVNRITVLQAFKVWNVTLLTLSAFLWGLIAQKLQLRSQPMWIGFSGLFVSFFVMKYSLYYPPLTDVAAFFLGIVAVWLYVIRKYWWLLAVGLLGYFTFPTMFYIAVLLFLLPSLEKSPREEKRREYTTRRIHTCTIYLSNLQTTSCGDIYACFGDDSLFRILCVYHTHRVSRCLTNFSNDRISQYYSRSRLLRSCDMVFSGILFS